jgi:hypothetical protein
VSRLQPRRLTLRHIRDWRIRNRRQAPPPSLPIYHHKRDSIEAHLTIVFAVLAVSRWIEEATGWSIRKFVRTARRYRTIETQADAQTITAEQTR